MAPILLSVYSFILILASAIPAESTNINIHDRNPILFLASAISVDTNNKIHYWHPHCFVCIALFCFWSAVLTDININIPYRHLYLLVFTALFCSWHRQSHLSYDVIRKATDLYVESLTSSSTNITIHCWHAPLLLNVYIYIFLCSWHLQPQLSYDVIMQAIYFNLKIISYCSTDINIHYWHPYFLVCIALFSLRRRQSWLSYDVIRQSTALLLSVYSFILFLVSIIFLQHRHQHSLISYKKGFSVERFCYMHDSKIMLPNLSHLKLYQEFNEFSSILNTFTNIINNTILSLHFILMKIMPSYWQSLNHSLILSCVGCGGGLPNNSLMVSLANIHLLAYLSSILPTFHRRIQVASWLVVKGEVGACLPVLIFIVMLPLFFLIFFTVFQLILLGLSTGKFLSHPCSCQTRCQTSLMLWMHLMNFDGVFGIYTVIRCSGWRSDIVLFSVFFAKKTGGRKQEKTRGNGCRGISVFGSMAKFSGCIIISDGDVAACEFYGSQIHCLRKSFFVELEKINYTLAKSLLPRAKSGESYQARIAPNHLNVFLNLANLIARNETRLEEADALYRQAISMRSDYTQAYINRGDILIKMNRTTEAQEVYERALFYDSSNPDIYYNLGVVLLEQGWAQQALAYMDKALDLDPQHQQSLLNSAILIQESGSAEFRPIALQRLLKLVKLDPENERVYFNLGMITMDDKDYESAEKWFRKAIELKGDFRSALFNLALLLVESGRALEAAPFLNQLVKHHPDHIKGLILLGDIYINNIRDLEAAEKCYNRILDVDPKHIQGMHNLCVVYVERGELLQAEVCLTQVLDLAPNEDYIHRHLNIVKTRLVQQQHKQKMEGGKLGKQNTDKEYEMNTKVKKNIVGKNQEPELENNKDSISRSDKNDSENRVNGSKNQENSNYPPKSKNINKLTEKANLLEKNAKDGIS
ncbi:unnamed protein product [Meganyctiphanes norvegica]|uniref:Dolichyl-phosphate-mannose--protein mannosyltransferase n=1 Tax=Meganyctiphanes norvegica TaxID=48144 RepID=A0AAV2R9Z0_MEGNR